MVFNPACTFHWKPTLGSNTVALKLCWTFYFCFMSCHNVWSNTVLPSQWRWKNILCEICLQSGAPTCFSQYSALFEPLSPTYTYSIQLCFLDGWWKKFQGSNYSLHRWDCLVHTSVERGSKQYAFRCKFLLTISILSKSSAHTPNPIYKRWQELIFSEKACYGSS